MEHALQGANVSPLTDDPDRRTWLVATSVAGAAAVAATAVLVVLILEAGLLFVAANTGFLGGPAVLANMAADSWVPRQFRQLSSRLVTQNGIVLMGAAGGLPIIEPVM